MFLVTFCKNVKPCQPFPLATFCHQKRFLMAKGCQWKKLTSEKASAATFCHRIPFPMAKVASGNLFRRLPFPTAKVADGSLLLSEKVTDGKGYRWQKTTFATGNLYHHWNPVRRKPRPTEVFCHWPRLQSNRLPTATFAVGKDYQRQRFLSSIGNLCRW